MNDNSRQSPFSQPLTRQLIGVVLAGGQSRRMEGQEKSLLELGGKPMIGHVIDRLEAQTGQLIISANGDPARFSMFNHEVVADTVEGFAGPLAGILAAMRWVQETQPEASNIITAAADTPFFPTSYTQNMIQFANERNENGRDKIVFASSNGRKHPVFAIWPVQLADDLEHFLLKEKERKVIMFAERYHLVDVEFENLSIGETSLDPFFNVNHFEDLETAKHFLN